MKIRNMTLAFIALFTVFSVSSCGKKDDAPLSSEQKAMLIEVSGSAGSGVAAATTAAQEIHTLLASLPVSNSLKDKIVEKCRGNCHVVWTSNANSITATIDGSNCPIEFRMVLTGSAGGMNLNFTAHYLVKDPEIAALNDVTGYDLTFSVTAQQNGNTITAQANGNGTIVSQKSGTVRMAAGGSVTANTSGSMEGSSFYRYDFPTFSAELRVTVSGTTYHYYLNGREISASEAYSFMLFYPSSSERQRGLW